MSRANAPDAIAGKRRYVRLHARVYAAGALIFLVVDSIATEGWWSFWPIAVWGFVVFLHHMAVKSLESDDAWATRRAMDLTGKAYDSGHIDSIRQRYGHTGTSDDPARKAPRDA